MKTVRKAIDVLNALAAGPGAMGVTEISARTGIDKAIVHRLLRTLSEADFVTQDVETRKYSVGPGFVQLAGIHLVRLQPLEVAKPHLLRLWTETNETVHLCVLRGLDAMLAQVYESRQGVRVSSHLGERAPLHCTAGGKVFLAFGPAELSERVIQLGLARRTSNTITEAKRLRIEIETTRRRGYAIDIEEMDSGYAAFAAPVLNRESECVAGVAVALPSHRMKVSPRDRLTRPLLECAGAISRALGATPARRSVRPS